MELRSTGLVLLANHLFHAPSHDIPNQASWLLFLTLFTMHSRIFAFTMTTFCVAVIITMATFCVAVIITMATFCVAIICDLIYKNWKNLASLKIKIFASWCSRGLKPSSVAVSSQ